MTRKTLLVFLSFLLATGINARSVGLFGHDKLDVSDTVRFAVNPFTGAIDELTVEGDKHHMNWIVKGMDAPSCSRGRRKKGSL